MTRPVPTAPVRDAQRAGVYEAENLVLAMFDRSADFPIVHVAGSSLTLPVERRFASIDSVQAYVDAVLGLGWVRTRWPRTARPVTVRRRTGAGKAHYDAATAVIAVPTHVGNAAWALRELVVLHEVAHHLTDPAEPAHGPVFASSLVDLIGGIVGHEAAFVLRVCLADVGARLG